MAVVDENVLIKLMSKNLSFQLATTTHITLLLQPPNHPLNNIKTATTTKAVAITTTAEDGATT